MYYLHCSLGFTPEPGGSEANVPCGLRFAINQELNSPDGHISFTSLEAPNSVVVRKTTGMLQVLLL